MPSLSPLETTERALFLRAFVFSICYGAAFYLLQAFFGATQILPQAPEAAHLLNWDVAFYKSIRDNGYLPDDLNNGFFVLFPLIWRWSHLGTWGIVCLNITFFSIGFALLMATFKEKNTTFWLLCLTLPSVYFAFLPYTEALFFLLGALMIYAIKKQRLLLIWLAVFSISLVRATTSFLLPALLLMELLSNDKRLWKQSLWKFCYRYAFPGLLGSLVFILWQYKETGIWMAYFKTQSDHWGHVFTLPSIPFSNIEGGIKRYHWLSALALFIDLTALGWLFARAYKWFKKGALTEPGMLVSAGYLSMILFFICCFNPKYGGPYTHVMGANRYTLVTPFCFYFLHQWYKSPSSTKNIVIYLVLANGFFALFRSFEGLSDYIAIAAMPTFCIAAFLSAARTEQVRAWPVIALIAFNFMVQMHLFQQFISPLFVD